MEVMLLDCNDKYEGYLEVTDENIHHKNRFSVNGLFSEQIFGPAEPYCCQCGKLQGQEYINETCKCCGVTIREYDCRFNQFARINIPNVVKCVNPEVLELFSSFLIPPYTNLKLKKIIEGEQFVILKGDTYEVYKYTDLHKLPEDEAELGRTGPNFFFFDLYPFLKKNMGKIVDKFLPYEDILFIRNIPVLPPEMRPIGKETSGNGDSMYIDSINHKLMNVLYNVKKIKDQPFVREDQGPVFLQKRINELFDEILGKFKGKTGFLRSNVLGKRIDYSGRAVIVCDVFDLPFGYCNVPYPIAKEIFKADIIRPLSKRLDMNPAELFMSYDNLDLKEHILAILREKFRGKPILLNRQPSLHRPGIQCVRIHDITDNHVITIHPLMTDPYNADRILVA